MDGKDWPDDHEKPHQYLENEKGDLIDALGLNLPSFQPVDLQLLTYTVTQETDEDHCTEPSMRRQARRFASLACLSQDEPPPTRWLCQLVADGYFVQRCGRRITCFCCGWPYPRHCRGCRHSQLNVAFHEGVGNPQQPRPGMEQFTSSGRVRIRDVAAVQDDTVFSLDAFHRRCRGRTEDDHDVHALDQTTAAAFPQSVASHADVRRASEASPAEPSGRQIQASSTESAFRPPQSSDYTIHRTQTAVHTAGRGYAHNRFRMCKVCYEQPLMTKFIPCNHELCCLQCAYRREICPFCYRHIDSVELYDRP